KPGCHRGRGGRPQIDLLELVAWRAAQSTGVEPCRAPVLTAMTRASSMLAVPKRSLQMTATCWFAVNRWTADKAMVSRAPDAVNVAFPSSQSGKWVVSCVKLHVTSELPAPES